MSKKLKKRLIRIIISLCLFIPLFIIDKIFDLSTVIPNFNEGWLLPFGLYLLIYLLISYDILIKAGKNIIHGRVFDENFLMIVATIGAFVLKEFPEAVAVMLFYQIGEFFQDLAVQNSRKEIASLMDIRPESANLIDKDGNIKTLSPNEININDTIRVNPGEKVPLDGVVIFGSTSLDTKALTGESLPRDITVGDDIISGTINLTSSIDIKVTKKYEDSSVAKILKLVEESTNKKSKQEKFITKFAKWYTPIVVISAVLLALIGSLVSGDYVTYISRALNFLVVSCPCAIVISVPLSFFVSIGRSAKLGILIKGSLFLENFNKAKTFVFDKTGTLTKGNFAISKVVPEANKDEILKYASIAESQSSHPIALSIKKHIGSPLSSNVEIQNIAGEGIVAKYQNETILCGNEKLLKHHNIIFDKVNEIGTITYVAKDNKYLGAIVIKDEIKEDAKEVIDYFNKNNIQTIMLTGDNYEVANEVKEQLGLSDFKASLLPQDKVMELDNILNNKKENELIAYVGDGINDAPSLIKSDIGIAMGALGSDAAIEASDIVLMNDNLNSLFIAKKIAKKTMRIVKENIIFALLVKVSILVLSSFGIANIWIAIFGDVGVALLCVLNSLRSGRIKL